MVEVFGSSISILLLVQLATTTIIVGLYAALTSIGENRADHQSDCQMVILVSFLMQEHPEVKSLDKIVEVPPEKLEDRDDDLKFFWSRLKDYQSHGNLPSVHAAATSTIREQFEFIVFSPVFGVAVPILLFLDGRRRVFRIRTTDIRKNYFSKMFLLAVGAVAYFLIGVTVGGGNRTIAVLAMIAAGFSLTGAIVGILVVTFQQQAWKAYWNDRLLEVLAAQDREQAHDQFNRALLLSNSINEQPDVPFPGRLGLYTGVYSVVQAAILLINDQASAVSG